MSGVFISYRRDDAGGFAGALVRVLNEKLGAEQVFLDVEDIRGGRDYVEVLNEVLANTDCLLVVIGKNWLDVRGDNGARRLDNPRDVVRREATAGLANGMLVIPVLIEGATMPRADELPEDLRPLATRNALLLSNGRWDYDVERIVDHVRAAMYSSTARAGAAREVPRGFIAGSAAALWLLVLIGAFLAIGLGLGAVSLYLASDTRAFVARTSAAEGRVVQLLTNDSGQTTPVVAFTSATGESIEFRARVASNPPAYQIGEKVPVRYEPGAPRTARLDSTMDLYLVPLTVGGIGLPFFLIGLIFMLVVVVKARRQRMLLRTAHPIMTTFKAAVVDHSITVNGRHPWRVCSEWINPISGQTIEFRSNPVWSDPGPQLKGRMITVLIDPENLRRYVVDLSALDKGDP